MDIIIVAKPGLNASLLDNPGLRMRQRGGAGVGDGGQKSKQPNLEHPRLYGQQVLLKNLFRSALAITG